MDQKREKRSGSLSQKGEGLARTPARKDNLDDLLNSSLDPKEVQQNELNILLAICQSDFEMLTKNKFQILVKPFPDEEEANFVAIRMLVTLHPMYPFVDVCLFLHIEQLTAPLQ